MFEAILDFFLEAIHAIHPKLFWLIVTCLIAGAVYIII